MVYQDILILALFIFLYSLFSIRIEKTAISGPVLALIVGFIFGPMLLKLTNVNGDTEDYRIIAELALALVLFTDASKVNLSVLENNASLPTRLLLIGLPLTICFWDDWRISDIQRIFMDRSRHSGYNAGTY